MQLAIDTSTDTASIALYRDGEVLVELTWRSGQNHTTELLPNLKYLLKDTGLAAITAVFVATGPVSFSRYFRLGSSSVVWF